MADEPGELETAADIAAARAQFLNEPPAILSSEHDPPPVDEAAVAAALEAEALDELAPKPPAAPVATPADAPPAPPAPAGTPDPYAEFGGIETVRNAHAVQEALRTQDGLRALVANGLTTLGYSVEQIQAALAAGTPGEPPAPPASVDAFPDIDDEDVVTGAQLKAIVESVAKNAVTQAQAALAPQLQTVEAQVAEQQRKAVNNATDVAIIEVLGPVPTDEAERAAYRTKVDDLVKFGAAHYDPNYGADPAHIRNAILTANAEIQAANDARFKAYLETKRQARDAQPVHTAGGAGGEGPLPEPKNLKEAREQAKAAGFFS